MTEHPQSIAQVQDSPIGDIRGAEDNPRIITKAAIDMVAKSIKRFGWQQPIVVDSSGVIIAGHTRHLAAKQLGLQSVPVVVAKNLTPEEAKAYRIADNRTGDFSSWDYPELVDQLEELHVDFSEELALADWQSIVGEFEREQQAQQQEPTSNAEPSEAPTGAPQGGSFQAPETDNSVGGTAYPSTSPGSPQSLGEGIADLELSPSAEAQITREFELVVVCESEAAAADVQSMLLELQEVVDVRYKRS